MLSCGLAALKDSSDTTGHIVVVRGFTEDGDVILNDPFGIPVDNNIVMKLKDFENIFSKSNGQHLYIEGPLWQHPGGEETDATNSFPIRPDNMWHNGIHLESESGFCSIGAGRLAAARNAEVENHGSSSFALVKYQMPESRGQFFYALYMHLKKIDLRQELEDFFL